MMVKVTHLHGNMLAFYGFLGFELEGGKWGYFKFKRIWFWMVLDCFGRYQRLLSKEIFEILPLATASDPQQCETDW